jgi:hypothetical protein
VATAGVDFVPAIVNRQPDAFGLAMVTLHRERTVRERNQEPLSADTGHGRLEFSHGSGCDAFLTEPGASGQGSLLGATETRKLPRRATGDL